MADYKTRKIKGQNNAYSITDGDMQLIINPYSNMLLLADKNGAILSNVSNGSNIMSLEQFKDWITGVDFINHKMEIDIPYFFDKSSLWSALARYSNYRSTELSEGYANRLYHALVAVTSKDYWISEILNNINTIGIESMVIEGIRRITEADLSNNNAGPVCENILDLVNKDYVSYDEAVAYVRAIGRAVWKYRSSSFPYDNITAFCKYVILIYDYLYKMRRKNGKLGSLTNAEKAALIEYRIDQSYSRDTIIYWQLMDFKEFYIECSKLINEPLLPESIMSESMQDIFNRYFSSGDKVDPIIWTSILSDLSVNDLIPTIKEYQNSFGCSEDEILKYIVINAYFHYSYEDSEDLELIYKNEIDRAKDYINNYINSKNNIKTNEISIFYNRYSNLMEKELCNGYKFKLPKDKAERDEIYERHFICDNDIINQNNVLFLISPLGVPVYQIAYEYSDAGIGLEMVDQIDLLPPDRKPTANEEKFIKYELEKINKLVCPQ